MTTPRVHAEWANRVAAEYGSASVTSQTLHWMVLAAFPDELIDTALRIVRDELDHSSLSHDTLIALGGSPDAAVLNVENLGAPSSTDGFFASLVDVIVRSFCLGETLAVPLFNAMYRHTTHPATRPMLERVLRDEAVHRAFGWDALDHLITMDPVGVRARVTEVLPAMLAQFESNYGTLRPSDELTEEEVSMGLMAIEQYVEVFWHTMHNDVCERFAKRGIQLPARYREPRTGH